jgi:hypothetical protein
VIDLLEGQLRDAVRSSQYKPVATTLVNAPRLWWLITRSVNQAQQVPVELRERPGVGAVEHHLAQARHALPVDHVDHLLGPFCTAAISGRRREHDRLAGV